MEQVKNQASTAFEELNYFNEGFTTTLVGLNVQDGEKVYVVDVVEANGDKKTSYYSVESGLKVMSMASQETPQGSMSIVDVINEYKEFDGVKMPANFVKKIGPQELNFKFIDASINKKFDTALLK